MEKKKGDKTENKTGAEPEEYSLLGDSWEEDPDEASSGESIKKLEKYSYFDGRKIAASIDFSESVRAKGVKLYEQGLMKNMEVRTGFETYRANGDQFGQVTWEGFDGGHRIRTTFNFTRTKVTGTSCDCPMCLKQEKLPYWYRSESRSKCEYMAALLLELKDYLKTHNVGDMTDKQTWRFLNACQERRGNLLLADKTVKEKSVQLKPRLVKKKGQLTVSFRIGTGKMFVIKQLGQFCAHVKNADTVEYGSGAVISHKRSNFTDESQKWLRFIERIVQEEEEFGQRMDNAVKNRYYYYMKPSSVGSSLNLFGWRLDEFYNILGEGTIDYEDRDAPGKTKMQLSCGEGNPLVVLQISEEKPKDQITDMEFHGIRVDGRLPELFLGMDQAYYVDNSAMLLCRSDRDFREKIDPLTSYVDDNAQFSLVIGRNRMSEFYYDILPTFEDIVEIKETDPEKFHSYLTPPLRFAFYLDAYDSDVYCRPVVRYGEKEFSLLDVAKDEEDAADISYEEYRDVSRESEMYLLLLHWFPEVRMQSLEMCCGGDEDRIYQLMARGVDELLSYGEVRCTNRFRSRKKVRKINVAVGVSVSSGLLDLKVSSEDISREELADLLASYQRKQTYYRLRDGSYVDMDDQSLQALSEMMDSMNLKPKDFVKGKMHLPLYRTLYLNKLLEENEELYSKRDSHFRKIVKEFKTVNDEDFEVPESLEKVMRPYQKDGYRWLRLLESWNFGGILADDMGLGKTLQMIAVLLSAKERRKAGETSCSLIVCPASVVFNWGEEFARFAPELSVLLVTGTAGERQSKIGEAGNYDVLVTSYDLLKRDVDLYEDLNFAYEVIDEAQYIKNQTTAAAKAVKVIKSTHRFALTGTPIENRLSELWSIFDFLMPGFLYSYEVFKREIETPIVKNQDDQAMQRLQKMTSPFILRRLKENVLKELPEKLEEVRYVHLSGEQQRLYDAQVIKTTSKVETEDEAAFNKNKIQILAELTKLRQICCDPSLCFENYGGESAKLEACLDLVKSAIEGGHRILLFSQFTSMLDILKKRLKEENIPYYTIVGATPKEERLKLAKEFNAGNVPVFLISLKAGGVGLNLTGADIVIHYDPWWNVAAENQATDRAHRIGQTRKVTEFKLITKDSIEEKILNLQNTKRDLADQIINGETGNLGSMTREDLLELLSV